MAKYLGEIMNHEVFSVAPDEHVQDVRNYFRTLGVRAAPVVDGRGRPIGFVSLVDLANGSDAERIEAVMSSPADPIDAGSTIEDAATKMAERNRHHLVVVDDEGRAVGYVGSLDVVRGLIGAPVPHPDAFTTYDSRTGASWSEEAPLSMDNVDMAPDGPGLISLIRCRVGEPDRVVWSAGSQNVRTKAMGILSGAEPTTAHLADEIASGAIRFRAAAASADHRSRPSARDGSS
jgi:CBS domain-containing protein